MMEAGIRAEVRIDTPQSCPIAQLSEEADATTRSISKSRDPNAPTTVTEEFMLDAEVDASDADVEQVFSYGSQNVYRFTRENDETCPCESVEAYDCPIVDVYTEDGRLHLAFHAPDVDRLQDVITNVRERYDDVDVERLIQSSEDAAEDDLVFVDRSTLTERQLECLRTAHEMGYFDHPKGANAGEVADELDITTSTFTEHLAAAQSKLMTALLNH